MLAVGARKNLTALGPLLGPRKLRLLCCGWYRREWGGSRGFSAAIDLAERFADGRADPYELATMRFTRRNLEGAPAWAICWPSEADPLASALRALAWLEGQGGQVGHDAERTRVLEDVAGHLLRPPVRIDPAWLAWADGTVPKLARVLYEERRFDQSPVLADALEDAGCDDAGLLEHLRATGHVRGCWAVDRILGRE